MAISFFRCLFHANDANGRPLQSFGVHTEILGAATGDPDTLAAVLAANGRSVPAGTTIVFDAIQNAGVYLT